MPAPVSFNISLAPLSTTFTGTPQQFATAIVERLTISPSEPWSSFLNGTTIPTSDSGPVLYNGNEWRVWDEDLGAYTYHKQNGAGIVDATVTLAKLAEGTAGSVLITDGDGAPAELLAADGTSGQVLTLVGGTSPEWVDTFVPTGTYFETTLASDQSLNTNGTYQVAFNTMRTSANVTYDTTNKKVPVVANQVWFFYASLQVEDVGAVSTDVEISLNIRVDGVATGPSNVHDLSFASARPRTGINAHGIVPITADGFVDVAVTVSEATPASPGLKISANTNTRFGGFRII